MKRLLILLVSALAVASCAELGYSGPEVEIGLEPLLATVTKASSNGPIVNGASFGTDRTIMLSAYYTDPNGAHTQNYFTDIPFTYYSSKWAGGTSGTPNPKYWPAQGRLDFIALSREGSASGWTGLTGISHGGANVATSVTYTMPDNSSNQDDIMAAYAGSRDCAAHEAVPLAFKHLQAQVCVTAKTATNAGTGYGVTINSITLRKAQYSGTVTFTGATASVSWSSLGSQKAGVAFGNADLSLTTTAQAYGKGVVLPQQSPTGANGSIDILIQYTVYDGKDKNGNAEAGHQFSYVYTIPATTWSAGNRYTYAFSFSWNEITCEPTVSEWGDGGTENVNVPTLPPVDLSLKTYSGADSPTQNTANCYVVRKAGTYDIPLVYGNGIKAGAVNAPAYTRQVSDYTADFVNHLGNTLTSPYIEENAGCTASEAGLLWQTNAGMVTEVSLADGSPCRKLRVKVEDIPADNGIAVVYVKDASGNIMWSWTLWMTTDNLAPETITNYEGVNYQMMPEGLCTIWDAGRTRCRNAYYQWGRKDPMPTSAAYNSASNCTLYTISGTAYSGFGSYGVANDSDAGGTVRSVANAIKMPEKFFLYYDSSSYSWNNLPWMNNFWNAAMTASGSLADDQASAIKTIYDPCPAGWMLPSGRAWTGFTTTGSNTTESSQWNVVGSFANGWTFKKTAVDAVGTYYPASGGRGGGSGGLGRVGSHGYWWSYAPHSQTHARLLTFSSGGVNPLNNDVRVAGFSVRPSPEQ